MDSPVLSVAIGLVFAFAVLAAVTSIVTEGIARFLGLRGEYLLRGLRTMLDGGGTFELHVLDPSTRPSNSTASKSTENEPKKSDSTGQADSALSTAPDTTPGGPTVPVDPTAPTSEPWVVKLMAHPLIAPSFSQGQSVVAPGARRLTRKERRTLPSYISPRSFAQAIIDLAVPDVAGKTTFDSIEKTIKGRVGSPVLCESLLSLLKAARGDIDAFRREIERWYDDQMARVSGWYKRHVRWISLAIGLGLVLALNLNTMSISRALYSDESLRTAVVTQAAQVSDCTDAEGPGACLQELQRQITKAQALGLPIGWGPVSRCTTGGKCSFWDEHGLADPDRNGGVVDFAFFLTALAGYLLMVLSLVPGARFWFDLLGRLGSLRSTGPKPTAAG